MMIMKGPSSNVNLSDADDKNLEFLLEAFGSMISAEDMASAYCQAGYDVNKASEILYNMLGSSSSNDIQISTDDLTRARASPVGVTVGTVSGVNGADYVRSRTLTNESATGLSFYKPRTSGVSVGTVSGVIGADYGKFRATTKKTCETTKPVNLMSKEFPASQIWVQKPNGADYARSRTLTNEPATVLSKSKSRTSGVSVGTVSGVIGADYGKFRTATKKTCETTKPVKLTSKEIPASQIWVEKPKPVKNAPTETMNKDIELFLLQMLGDGFQLDIRVIRDVLASLVNVIMHFDISGGCGYDVQESMEKLMNMSAPTLHPGGITSSMVDQTKSTDTHQDLDVKFEEKLQLSDSSKRSNLEKEVLNNLFNAPERSTIPEKSTIPPRQPRIRKYGLVTGPLEDGVIEFKTAIVKKDDNGDGNVEVEDNYETLREAVMEHWTTMKQYYRAAADAYAKGSYELSNKLMEQGHFYMAKAREADETSTKILTQTRDDGEVISINLNDYDPKEAIRLVKTQLKSMCGIPSIHYLKVMVGTNDDKNKPNARKRLISKLLERDAITWTEEQDGQIMAIRIDVINPKRLSFNKK
ncbi:hypothetical protein SSX86_021156 [Deinandra increscens subsp. villosa]|uniref:DUF1771 domain-containing protein n=1 Tax=Deinandra increscens subsp. villosa TaxID=3103831 RepID=A0AAP0CUE9_9ASTR